MSEPIDSKEAACPQAPAGSEPAASGDQFKTKPHLRPAENGSDGSCDTMTQLIRPPDSVIMEAGVKKMLKISCHKCLQKLDVTFLEAFSRFNCPSCEVELIVPRWFDNYLLEEPGGIGGMATVYRALDLALDREVAIKVLNPDVASQAERSELFLHEARTAATINHYAVIPIYTCGVFEGQPYIVMQYMGGGSLEAKLKLAMGSLPVGDVAKWIRDVAEGLDNARRHGITHHDIKPGNIMLDSDGNAKIGDFGLAQAVNDSRSSQVVEMTKAWVSPHYVSPEKIRDGKEDFLGDIYSLGATFYHLATGFTPFSSSSIDELLKMRLTLDPLPPHRQRPDLPLPLAHLILAMMDREPDKRPHYREIAKSLNEYLKSTDSKKTVLKGPKLKTAAVNLNVNLDRGAAEQPKDKDSEEEAAQEAAPRKSFLPLASIIGVAAIAGLCVYGWQSGKLQQAFPFLKTLAAGSGQQQEEADKVPFATAAFVLGDVAAASEAAEKAFTDISAPAEVRTQAAVQLAIAKYLSKDSGAKDNCAFIAERLEAIRTASDPSGELSLGDPPAKSIVSFLGNYDNKPSDLSERLSSASPSLRLAGSFAIFLRSTRSKMPKEMVLSAFNDYKKAAQAAPKQIWGNAWQGRLDLWSDYLAGAYLAPGAADVPAVEPLFASLPQQLGIKPGSPAEKPKPKVIVFQDGKEPEQPQPQAGEAKPGPTPQELALLEKFNETGVMALLSKQAVQRPRPAGLKFEQQALDRYLASVSEPAKASEAARAAIVSGLRSALERSLLRIPMDFDSFESPSGELGKGALFTNGKDLIYKTDSGRTAYLKWEELGAKHFILLADSYSRLLESVAFDAAKDSALRHEVAGEILKLAVLAGWCGDYRVASQSAQRALRADPGLGGEAERLLLK